MCQKRENKIKEKRKEFHQLQIHNTNRRDKKQRTVYINKTHSRKVENQKLALDHIQEQSIYMVSMIKTTKFTRNR